MVTTQEIQKLLDDVNFGWVDAEVFTRPGNELRDTNTFTIMFSLLIEIFGELKETKELVVKLQKGEQPCLRE